jgi:hypothetical protein
MAMSGAERQKRYRDKKRGGPPRGRWAGHTKVVDAQGPDWRGRRHKRTWAFMQKWLAAHAPGVPLDHKITTSYETLRDLWVRAYNAAWDGATEAQREGRRWDLRERFEDGDFRFEWVREP